MLWSECNFKKDTLYPSGIERHEGKCIKSPERNEETFISPEMKVVNPRHLRLPSVHIYQP